MVYSLRFIVFSNFKTANNKKQTNMNLLNH